MEEEAPEKAAEGLALGKRLRKAGSHEKVGESHQSDPWWDPGNEGGGGARNYGHNRVAGVSGVRSRRGKGGKGEYQ